MKLKLIRHLVCAAALAGLAAVPVAGATSAAAATAGKRCTRSFDNWSWTASHGKSILAKRQVCLKPDNVGNYWLIFQSDGNLVYYRSGSSIWSSKTGGRGYRLALQTDGNMVIYTKRGKAVWANYAMRAPSFQTNPSGGWGVGFDGASSGKTGIWPDWGEFQGECGPGGACGSRLWNSLHGTR